MGADAEGGGLGPRAEAVEGNARPSHTRSQPWKDVVRSMFAAAQQSVPVRVRGVGMLARMGASADGEAMGVRGAGGRVVAGDTSRAARTKWARENGGHRGGGERASDERCNKW